MSHLHQSPVRLLVHIEMTYYSTSQRALKNVTDLINRYVGEEQKRMASHHWWSDLCPSLGPEGWQPLNQHLLWGWDGWRALRQGSRLHKSWLEWVPGEHQASVAWCTRWEESSKSPSHACLELPRSLPLTVICRQCRPTVLFTLVSEEADLLLSALRKQSGFSGEQKSSEFLRVLPWTQAQLCLMGRKPLTRHCRQERSSP